MAKENWIIPEFKQLKDITENINKSIKELSEKQNQESIKSLEKLKKVADKAREIKNRKL
jgi:hypothetical protein